MGAPKTIARHDVKIAILRLLSDGRERTANEVTERLARFALTPHSTSRQLTELFRAGVIQREKLPGVEIWVYRTAATGKCPACGRDVSFLIPGAVYRCPCEGKEPRR